MKPLPSVFSFISCVSTMLCDPVLAFIKAYRLRGSAESLKHAALAKFDSALMCKAKKGLWGSECATSLTEAGLSFHPRRGSEKRTQAAADLDDILTAFEKLDELDKISEIFCEASDLVWLPPIVVDSCAALVQQNSASLETIKDKLDSLSDNVAGLSTKLSKLSGPPALSSMQVPFTSGSNRVPSDNSLSSTARPMVSHKGDANSTRHENLIVFGIEEQSMTDTMDSVKKMVEFVVGRPAPVKDLYRIGKFKKPDSDQSAPARPRPIILKLASPWDRRLVLANRFSLKNYDISRVFIREDFSLDERKRRLQSRNKSMDSARPESS